MAEHRGWPLASPSGRCEFLNRPAHDGKRGNAAHSAAFRAERSQPPPRNSACELSHPLILITARPILGTGQVRGLIESAARHRRSLLLVAPHLTAEVVSELVARRLRAGPVGAGVFAGQTEPPWEGLEAGSPLIGSARFVAARRDSTTISGGAGDQAAAQRYEPPTAAPC